MASNAFFLNSYYDQSELRREIRAIPFSGGETNTADALRLSHMEQFTYFRGDRVEVGHAGLKGPL